MSFFGDKQNDVTQWGQRHYEGNIKNAAKLSFIALMHDFWV